MVLTQLTAQLHKDYNQQNPEMQCNISFFRSVRRQSKFIKLSLWIIVPMPSVSALNIRTAL